ncbi:hypothetical protein [Reinekea sp. G2M2-21]|uniref:hypothetical protein n=1 Tax=Reinekea sp. G2M2-21 TaxID=2788942 RepID=UPI0018AC3656|nr:hypothetical protein [Reinekea sp. G2M2-21]
MIALILKAEQRRIMSDAFLLLILLLTPLIAILVKVYWPVLDATFPNWHMERFTTVTSIFIALLTPMMLGLVLGFNLLTDREQGMLTVVRTTPAGLPQYLLIRSSGYLLLSLIITPVLHELLGFVELAWWQLAAITVAALVLLPFSALLLLSFAHNLVEGFAIMKGTGFLISVPVILALFVPAPWYWLAAPLPTWWTLWGYIELANQNLMGLVWLALGMVMQIGLSAWLWRRLMRATN